MNIYKRRFISRLGLMHMIATNLCVWLKVVILETKHEIQITHEKQLSESHSDLLMSAIDGPTITKLPDQNFMHVSDSDTDTIDIIHATDLDLCHKQKIMHNILENSGPFLFPCSIEFCLSCGKMSPLSTSITSLLG